MQRNNASAKKDAFEMLVRSVVAGTAPVLVCPKVRRPVRQSRLIALGPDLFQMKERGLSLQHMAALIGRLTGQSPHPSTVLRFLRKHGGGMK